MQYVQKRVRLDLILESLPIYIYTAKNSYFEGT